MVVDKQAVMRMQLVNGNIFLRGSDIEFSDFSPPWFHIFTRILLRRV